jgi:peptidoglycan-N-acetylglucosamine deacetylase
MPKPIFYDPKQARWKRLRRIFDVIGIVITFLVVFFVLTSVFSESLPELSLNVPKHSYRPLHPKRHLADRRGRHRKSTLRGSQVKLNSDEGVRAAFYVTWDAASFSSLHQYARQLDLLFPEWLHVLSPDGRLQGITAANQPFDVFSKGKLQPVDDRVMPFLKASGAELDVLPLVNNYNPETNTWTQDIATVLTNPASRANFRREILAFLASDKYRGLMVDFEEYPDSAQAGYLALLAELHAAFHDRGLKLYVAAQLHISDWEMSQIASRVDGLVLMNYDEHYAGGAPGPVASQEWFTKNLARAAKIVPRDKLICAIANYGYDWVRAKPHTPRAPQDTNRSVQEAWLEARDSEEDIDFDYDSQNPHFSYLDDNQIRHDVWFLDAVTALNQMRAAQSLGIDTFALWRLGAEDRALWKVWDMPGEAAAPQKLETLAPGQDVDMEGDGEILRIEERPADGARRIQVDPNTNLIVDEIITTYPTPYRVARYGASRKQIAITFDDGPDPEWTGKILDVLKSRNVRATFFVIGLQAEKFPAVTSRMFSEGHDIGNHTFTHPDISLISDPHLRWELNVTERLFASRLGIKTVLFRPPYSVDQEPDTADQVRPLEVTQDIGYITVGDKIDPNDWRDNPRRTPEEIAQDVFDHLPPCASNDQRCGNIILMHDGGGNRANTVAALALIIDGLRSRGFEVGSVSQLLGKNRADVMPPLAPGERWTARIDWVAFSLAGVVLWGIPLIFFLGDILMSGRLIFVGALAIFDRLRQGITGKVVQPTPAFQPNVAILIPAYNEEKVIERTVRAALRSDYPNLRVIVIDDGSKDQTLEVVRQSYPAEIASGKVLVLTKPNAGKASALNLGLQHLREDEPIFVGIDADTVIAREAVTYLVPHFQNAKIGALAGNAKVGNRVNLWTRWQALEYITSQNFERRALDVLGAVSVVPGAIGAWRASAVRKAGGYHTDTVAEDADLTMNLLRNGYRVEYEDRALAFTEAPTNARGLMRQRFRWSFGILQAVWKHRAVFGRKGVLGFIALPNILIFQILLPLVSPFIDIMFAVGAIEYLVSKHFHPDSTNPADFQKLVVYFILFLVIDFAASTVAFLLERRTSRVREDTLLLTQVWLQRFAYRQLFSVVLFRPLKRVFEGKPFAWDKLERTAAVKYAG